MLDIIGLEGNSSNDDKRIVQDDDDDDIKTNSVQINVNGFIQFLSECDS